MSPAPGSVGAWFLASRPKTLAASVAPVAVGVGLAVHDGAFHLGPAAAALAGALLIQIGTNFTNDVADFHRGADTEARLGPVRVVQAGLLSSRAVAVGAAGTFLLASLVGLYLVAVAGPAILVVGVAGIAAGVAYTWGPYPLAYLGLGDVFVLVFFGIAAVGGTYFVQALRVTPAALGLGVAVGCLAVMLLAVNNLRDVETDRVAGKRTLAVRLGPDRTRAYIVGLVALALAIPVGLVVAGFLSPAALLALAAIPVAVPPVRDTLSGLEGSGLNRVLAGTARLQIVYAGLLSLGLAAARLL